MKPVDPRLLRYATGARWFFAVGAVLGVAQTACIVAFAWLVSQTIVAAIAGETLAGLAGSLAALVGVVVLRSALVWLMEYVSARGAAVVKSELRRRAVGAVTGAAGRVDAGAGAGARDASTAPHRTARPGTVALATTIGHGLDALDPYFSKYLPQLILTALATPALVVVLFAWDWTSGLTVLLTLPLIPVFMVLIGWATEAAQKAQWQQLSTLAGGFLDVVEGLSTLKVFGREQRQVARIRQVTDEYRNSTMKVLRLSFLSGFALELAASLSVALVAVSVGLRLVSGDLGLGVGLFVLLLAPEAFLPIRQVGAQFHASAEGVAAADDVFAVIEAGAGAEAGAGTVAGVAKTTGTTVQDASSGADPQTEVAPQRSDRNAARAQAAPTPSGASAAWTPRSPSLHLDQLTVPGRLATTTASFAPGSFTVITGPSGAGKSSLFEALLGFAGHEGKVTFDGRVLTRAQLAWAGQRPGLLAGSVFENVVLGSGHPSPEVAARALALAGFGAGAGDIDPAVELGVNGSGLSGGQAQRVAVARAVYRMLERGCPVLLLDEPSSALDARAEEAMLAGLRELARTGSTVIAISHRPAFHDAADRVVHIDGDDRAPHLAEALDAHC